METCDLCGEPCHERWPVYVDDIGETAFVCADCVEELDA